MSYSSQLSKHGSVVCFSFLMFHHEIIRNYSLAMSYGCVHSGFNWRQRRKQNLLLTYHLGISEKFSHLFFLVVLL